MNEQEMSPQWQQQSQAVSKAIAQWRQAHPKATMAEIEKAVDEQMNALRARMIEEVALSSEAVSSDQRSNSDHCPQCGQRMQARGRHQRHLQTQGGQEVTLTRRYQSCPSCGYSFFPPR
jgi:predicted RNA-binding Zn-ribbon protein involved in translation (DUF1610 family)